MTATETTHFDTTGRACDSWLAVYGISDQDLVRIRTYGESIVPRLDEYVTPFYAWLAKRPEYGMFFTDEHVLRRAQTAQVSYWQDFFRGIVDEGYIERRREVGITHARIGLPLPAYFASMNFSLGIFVEEFYEGEFSDQNHAATIRAITKLIMLDTAIVTDTFSEMTQRTIREQSESLMQMSTPVTEIWEGILMLPVVGIIDSKRAQDVMNAMLTAISDTQSRIIIMDISGVAVVDTAVANHLIKITKATKLMGCECTISGVSPAIAQTIVELGIDVGTVETTATLRDALRSAFQRTGARI